MVSRVLTFLVCIVLYQANESDSVERKNMTDQDRVSTQQPLLKEENGTISKGTILEASFNNDVYDVPYNNTLEARRKRSTDTNKSINDAKSKREDEDMLELMVRIAETPEEWERIQHVLRQISVEENKAKVIKNESTDDTVKLPRSVVANEKNSEDNRIKGNVFVIPLTEERQNISLRNNPYVNVKRNEKVPISSKRKKVKTDSGWPNFSEIIRSRKKWKHHFFKNDKVDKTRTKHTKHDDIEVSDGIEKYNKTENLGSDDFLNFIKTTKSHNNNNESKHHVGNTSRLQYERYSSKTLDNGIITENNNVVSIKSQDLKNISAKESFRHSRPNFQYHRVTSSPRDEHKNNAILAVSVVRKNYVVPSTAPTAMATETAAEGKESRMPWSHARHLHKLQEQLKSIAAVKSRLRHRWQDKEHRHHQFQSHRHHLHPPKSDINGLHH